MPARRTAPLFLLCLVLLLACSPARRGPDRRYLGILLNARDLGAQELQRLSAENEVIRTYLVREGQPDFVLEPSVDDVEIIYTYTRSRLVHFHRGPDGTWTVTEVTPLPSGLVQLLPRDLRAGTGEALDPTGVGCWRTTVPDRSCRTCCKTGLACTIDCELVR